ncbi:MAG: 30S ribosome-binding factor RbfA [Planctomycetia bacterium]|nr:30S ribosome-binding factor RbfA [Planctomycetia bacterium]
MGSRRALRVAEAVREVVASAILFELQDPRVRGVTVTRSVVSDDLQVGRIYISVMAGPTGEGDRDKAEQLALHGLRSATGFLQSKVADRLQIRCTPRLSFYVDEGVKNQREISRILREVLPPDPSQSEEEEEEVDVADAGSGADVGEVENGDTENGTKAADTEKTSRPD